MQPLDSFARAYDAAVANLDRWVDAQKDVARVEREQTATFWRARLTPTAYNAAPVELILHRSQRCDLSIGHETYENRPTGDPARWQNVLDAISEGHATVLHWRTCATNTLAKIETVVTLADGSTFHGERTILNARATDMDCETRTVLPWRR
jgi:hypothetical protein